MDITERIAQIIRQADGNHSLGAAALAEVIVAGLGLKPDTTPHSRFVEGGTVVSHQGRIVSDWYETHRTKAT
jgi:hypothetical protein